MLNFIIGFVTAWTVLSWVLLFGDMIEAWDMFNGSCSELAITILVLPASLILYPIGVILKMRNKRKWAKHLAKQEENADKMPEEEKQALKEKYQRNF